jgi:hypothetical protein
MAFLQPFFHMGHVLWMMDLAEVLFFGLELRRWDGMEA